MTSPHLQDALTALASGQIVVIRRPDGEGHGELLVSAAAITVEQMAFLVRHGSGIVFAAMTDRRAEALDLPLLIRTPTEGPTSAVTISVDHALTGTGISAADRAMTLRSLAHPATQPSDLRRPGHIGALRARPGGANRTGHVEAIIELLRLAGTGEVGAVTELLDDTGTPLTGFRIDEFAAANRLPVLPIGARTVLPPNPSGRAHHSFG